MIRGMATLLAFQLAGELAARLGHVPISGPICGMAALLAWLHLKGEVESEFAKVCDGILANMAILFVPVGVGAMSFSGLFASAWPVIALAIVVGGVATLLTTAFVTRTLIAWTERAVSQVEDQGRRPVSQ
jgi:holin-like protein